MALLAAVPLFSVLYMLIARGGKRLGLELFTQLPPAGLEQGGGFGNAILGTLVMVAIASAISVPARHHGRRLPRRHRAREPARDVTRFVAKVLTGFPSILAGVFVYAWLVLAMGTYSAIAGGVALAVLMLPTVMLTAEQAMRMVPAADEGGGLRHGLHSDPDGLEGGAANRAAGHPHRRDAGGGGGGGQPAPLLFTALFSDYWIGSFTRAHRLARHAHLQLLGHAVPEPDRARLGGLAGARALVLAFNS